jgi:UDP-glucose 4-epimerase
LNLLLTGGTGYIGSHAAAVMLEANHQVILFDNLSNSKPDVVARLEKITGKKIPFVEGDIRDTALLEKTIRDFKVEAVIHFAGLKAVAESILNPIDYYANNVQGSISVLKAMKSCNVKTIVFSSSATVYGEPKYLPYDEKHPTNPINPYGRTKLQVEQMLRDLCESDCEWRVATLRYFNPAGAHESGLIGDEPKGIPNNLMPILNKVASGEISHIEIFGDDYQTIDGTCVRDFIHIMDLVEGHLAALDYLKNHFGLNIFNLGTGCGSTVFQLIQEYELATTKKIPYKKVSRREGDTAISIASVDYAKSCLNWNPSKTLAEVCRSELNWIAHRGLF